jgi:hypothetical protein
LRLWRRLIEAAVHDGVANDVVAKIRATPADLILAGDALRDPAGVWGRLIADGITAFQTDEPAALLDFVQHAGRGH